MKRYAEPMAHGPEARKPMARRAVHTVRQREIAFSDPRDPESDPLPFNRCRITIILLS